MKNEIIQRLDAVSKTLCNIEVKGKSNLMNLSGCIMVVDELLQLAQSLPEDLSIANPKE